MEVRDFIQFFADCTICNLTPDLDREDVEDTLGETNKSQRKPKGQSRISNLYATIDTRHRMKTNRAQHSKLKIYKRDRSTQKQRKKITEIGKKGKGLYAKILNLK